MMLKPCSTSLLFKHKKLSNNMAAGDIITSKGYIFTPEDIAMFTSPIQERIATTAKDPGEFELVESLQGISSLPVFFQSGASYRLVRVAVSILRGVDGREVHLQVSEAGYIQWRWSDGMWQNLIALADLKGDKGETPTFRTGTSGIEWKYLSEGEDAWKMLVSYDVLKLKFSDLTAEQIAEFWRQIPADVLALFQQPAVDAAARADEKLVQISQDVNQTREKLVEDAGKVNTDLTTAVGALEERAETVISETNKVKEAAEEAVINADNATAAANGAAGLANTAAKDTNKATELAVVAAQLAGEKAEQASSSADKADTAAGAADDAAALASEKATLANNAAGVADTATGKANTAIGNAEMATKRANDAAAAAENIVSGIRPDWAVDDPTSENYIANKPDIPDWALEPEAPDSFPEAPKDNKTYGRKDGLWSEVNSAGNMDGGTAYSVYGGSLVMDGGNAND